MADFAIIDGKIVLKENLVEVVRCQECLDFRHCLHNEYNDPNGFCAWGKKKDAEEE